MYYVLLLKLTFCTFIAITKGFLWFSSVTDGYKVEGNSKQRVYCRKLCYMFINVDIIFVLWWILILFKTYLQIRMNAPWRKSTDLWTLSFHAKRSRRKIKHFPHDQGLNVRRVLSQCVIVEVIFWLSYTGYPNLTR